MERRESLAWPVASELALLLGQELCDLPLLSGIQVHKATTDAQHMVGGFQFGETYLYVGREGVGAGYREGKTVQDLATAGDVAGVQEYTHATS